MFRDMWRCVRDVVWYEGLIGFGMLCLGGWVVWVEEWIGIGVGVNEGGDWWSGFSASGLFGWEWEGGCSWTVLCMYVVCGVGMGYRGDGNFCFANVNTIPKYDWNTVRYSGGWFGSWNGDCCVVSWP